MRCHRDRELEMVGPCHLIVRVVGMTSVFHESRFPELKLEIIASFEIS